MKGGPASNSRAGLRDPNGLDKHRVVLHDADLETAEILRLFLQLASESRFTEPPDLSPEGTETLRRLVGFTHKWKAPGVRATLWTVLHNQVWDARKCHVSWVFKLAAQEGQSALCVAILRAGSQTPWGIGGEARAGASVWDPCGWPLSFVRDLPHTYLWALARAYGEAVQMDGGLYHNLADAFDRFIRKAG